MTDNIGYCISCENDSCPHPDQKALPKGNCRDWSDHRGTDETVGHITPCANCGKNSADVMPILRCRTCKVPFCNDCMPAHQDAELAESMAEDRAQADDALPDAPATVVMDPAGIRVGINYGHAIPDDPQRAALVAIHGSGKPVATDVLSPDQAKLVDEIKTYHAGLVHSYEHQIQYAFMAGVKLIALKESCPHGNAKSAQGEGFTKICEKFIPGLSHSARVRYMDFVKLVSLDNTTVGNIKSSRLLLENGDLPEDEKKQVLDAVYKAADGKSWTAFYRDLDLCRQKKPQEHHPVKPLTPDEKIEQEKFEAAERRGALLQEISILTEEIQSKENNPVMDWTTAHEWKEVLRALRGLSKLVNPLTKRKMSPTEKKAAKPAAKAEAEDTTLSPNLRTTHTGPKPFGWEVVVEFHHSTGKSPKTFHWRGCTERQARTKGMMQRNAQSITEVRPVTEQEWINAYGLGRM